MMNMLNCVSKTASQTCALICKNDSVFE